MQFFFSIVLILKRTVLGLNMVPITNPGRTPEQTQLAKNIIINETKFVVNLGDRTNCLPPVACLLGSWCGGLLPVSARLLLAVWVVWASVVRRLLGLVSASSSRVLSLVTSSLVSLVTAAASGGLVSLVTVWVVVSALSVVALSASVRHFQGFWVLKKWVSENKLGRYDLERFYGFLRFYGFIRFFTILYDLYDFIRIFNYFLAILTIF